MCNVLNRIVFDNPQAQMNESLIELPTYFPGRIRAVQALGKYLYFGTTVSETEFRRIFGKFRITR